MLVYTFLTYLDTNLTDKSITLLSNNLSNMKKLKYLDLTRNDINDYGITSLSNSFSSITSILSLHLECIYSVFILNS